MTPQLHLLRAPHLMKLYHEAIDTSSKLTFAPPSSWFANVTKCTWALKYPINVLRQADEIYMLLFTEQLVAGNLDNWARIARKRV